MVRELAPTTRRSVLRTLAATGAGSVGAAAGGANATAQDTCTDPIDTSDSMRVFTDPTEVYVVNRAEDGPAVDGALFLWSLAVEHIDTCSSSSTDYEYEHRFRVIGRCDQLVDLADGGHDRATFTGTVGDDSKYELDFTRNGDDGDASIGKHVLGVALPDGADANLTDDDRDESVGIYPTGEVSGSIDTHLTFERLAGVMLEEAPVVGELLDVEEVLGGIRSTEITDDVADNENAVRFGPWWTPNEVPYTFVQHAYEFQIQSDCGPVSFDVHSTFHSAPGIHDVRTMGGTRTIRFEPEELFGEGVCGAWDPDEHAVDVDVPRDFVWDEPVQLDASGTDPGPHGIDTYRWWFDVPGDGLLGRARVHRTTSSDPRPTVTVPRPDPLELAYDLDGVDVNVKLQVEYGDGRWSDVVSAGTVAYDDPLAESEFGTVTDESPEDHEIRNSDAEIVVDDWEIAEDFADPGETVRYSAAFTNEGERGPVAANLYVGDRHVKRWTASVPGGHTVQGSNTIEIETYDAGAEAVRLEFEASDAAATEDLTVLGDAGVDLEPSLDVSSDEVRAGESVEVGASLISFGEDGREAMRLWLGDRLVMTNAFDADADTLSDEMTLETLPEDVGAQELHVELVVSGTTDTVDLHVWDDCTRSDADGLLPTELSAPDGLRVGETASVDLGFQHCGADGKVISPELTVDGREAWTSVWLVDHREERTATAEVVPQAGEWGEVTLRAQTDVGAVERTVEVEPAPFEVSLAGEPVVDADGLSVPVAVENAGQGADRQPIALGVDDAVEDLRTVELAAGERTEVELSAPVPADDVTVRVASRTDDASTTVEGGSPDVSLALGSVRDPVSHAASVVYVPLEVANDGTLEASVEVVATVDGRNVSETVAVPAGETTTVSPSVPVDPDPSVDLQLEAAALDSAGQRVDSVTRSLAVAPPLEAEVDGADPRPGGEEGLYTDMNGDGSVTQGDVSEFFGVQHRETLQEHPEFFDVNGNGDVGLDDVIALFQRI